VSTLSHYLREDSLKDSQGRVRYRDRTGADRTRPRSAPSTARPAAAEEFSNAKTPRSGPIYRLCKHDGETGCGELTFMRDGACGTTECLHRLQLAQRTPEEKAEAKRSALRCEEVSAAFRRLLSAQRGTPEKKAARLAFDDLMARRLATAEDSSDAKTRPPSTPKTAHPAADKESYEYLTNPPTGRDAPPDLTRQPMHWGWSVWKDYVLRRDLRRDLERGAS
jgi:hypothetical protein